MLPGITITTTSDGQQAQVRLAAGEGRIELTEEALLAELAAAGFGDWRKNSAQLVEAVRRYNDGDLATLLVAQRCDASVAITVTSDKMAAVATATKAEGGRPLDAAMLNAALAEAGVVAGIDAGAIDRLVAAGSGRNERLAAGTPPRHGSDTVFKVLVECERKLALQEGADGSIDFREAGEILVVPAGTALMVRLPPTEGEPGLTVTGVTVPAKPGKELGYGGDLEGTELAPDDPDLLLAAVKGHPVKTGNGFKVENVIKLKEVGLASGNVHYDGTLVVAGDIKAGMTVEVTGDLQVGGVVEEGVQLTVGGDLTVRGGILGSATHQGDGGETSTYVRCTGDVVAAFAEYVAIEAGARIVLREAAMHCKLTATASVLVGEKGARTGHVIGGRVQAGEQLHCVVLGSPASIPTKVVVGVDPYAGERQKVVQARLAELRRRRGEALKGIDYYEAAGDENCARCQQLKAEYAALQLEIDQLAGEERELKGALARIEQARISVERDIFAGVEIEVAGRRQVVYNEGGRVTFRIENNRLVAD